MDSITLRDISSLPGDEKHSLEILLHQQALQRGEKVFIMTFQPGIVPVERTRRRAHDQLLPLLDAAQEHAAAVGVTPEEADRAVNEAMEQIRPRQS